jgi:NAD dependent epimerase/dehydratase family enzyme
LGRPSALAMPSWAARFIFGELADELLLEGQRVFPGVLLDRGFKFSFNTLEQALKSLLD